MSWSEILSITATVIAALGVVVTSWISLRAYRVAALQLLPRLPVGTGAVRTVGGSGHRYIEFEAESVSGRPDWMVAGASIRWNWRRMRFLAHGESEYSEEADCGNTYHHYVPHLPWERRVVFDPPVKAGVVMIHPDAPDCEVLLKITLSTSPNLTSHWRVKSKWFGGFPSGDRL